MVSQERATRIAKRIRKELSELLLFEISDPSLEGAFITKVRVDRELAYANIFISALEGSDRKDEILEGCERALGFIRFQLVNRIELRSFPQLRFYWDPSPEYVDQIDRLISSLHEEERGDIENDG